MHAGILQKGEGEGEVMSMKYSKAIKKGIAYVLAICLTAGTVVSPVFAEEPETVVAQETVEQETSEQETTEVGGTEEETEEQETAEQETTETEKQETECTCDIECNEDKVNSDCIVCSQAESGMLAEVCEGKHLVAVSGNSVEEETEENIKEARSGQSEYSVVWDGTAAKELQGEGTRDNPWIISCGQELEYLRLQTKKGNNYAGEFVQLSKDIYLNTVSDEEWSDENLPENLWEGIDGFSGTFDGNGYTIFGLCMKKDGENTGLFNTASVKNLTCIKNLTLSHVYVSGSDNVGAFVGNGLWIYILNCSITDGIVKGSGNNVGGFIGKSGSAGWYGTTIKESSNYASISGKNYVGGFLGYSYIGNSLGAYDPENCGGTETITLKELKNHGTVSGSEYVGGIAGSIGRNLNCGGMSLEKFANYAEVKGSSCCGGIFGQTIANYEDVTVEEATNKGKITGNTYIGGIVGRCDTSDNNEHVYQNCYNEGDITGAEGSGGIVGLSANTWWGENILLFCYNAGIVNNNDLIGKISNSVTFNGNCTVKSCYYMKDIQDISGEGIIKFSEDDRGNVSKFELLDFENVWKMTADYPAFLWEDKEEIDTPDNIMGSLKIFSSCSDCTIGIGQIMGVSARVVRRKEPVKEPDSYSYAIEDETVVKQTEIRYDDYGPTIGLEGLKEGSTKVTFWHIPTGKKVSIIVNVIDNLNVYDIKSLAALENGENSDRVITSSHMGLDNFHLYKNLDETYTVTFDAYNSLAHYAAVEVYDKNNKLIQVERIDKKENYQTGIFEVMESGVNLFVTITNFMKDWYKQYQDPFFTEHTQISVTVPDGGKIFISNNYEASVGCMVYNSVDIDLNCIDKSVGLLKAGKKLQKEHTIFKAFSKEVQEKTMKELVKKGVSKDFKKNFLKKYSKKIGEKFTESFLSSKMIDCSNAFIDALYEYESIDFGGYVLEAADKSAIDIAEDIFETKASIFGAVMQAMFSINDYLNLLVQFTNFSTSSGNPGVEIHVNSNDDWIVSEDVIVETVTGIPVVYDSLLVENLSAQAEYKYIYEDFINSKSLIIYNITLYRENEEVQPEGKIKVSVPLPTTYDKSTTKIYRMEKDGSYTDMNAAFSDGFMSFITDHLSVYVMVAEKNSTGTETGNDKTNKGDKNNEEKINGNKVSENMGEAATDNGSSSDVNRTGSEKNTVSVTQPAMEEILESKEVGYQKKAADNEENSYKFESTFDDKESSEIEESLEKEESEENKVESIGDDVEKESQTSLSDESSTQRSKTNKNLLRKWYVLALILAGIVVFIWIVLFKRRKNKKDRRN